MRRLARRLFALCSAVSLVLWVAVCVLWAGSYLPHDVRLRVVDGRVLVLLTRGSYTAAADRRYFTRPLEPTSRRGGGYPRYTGPRGLLSDLYADRPLLPWAAPRPSPTPPGPGSLEARMRAARRQQSGAVAPAAPADPDSSGAAATRPSPAQPPTVRRARSAGFVWVASRGADGRLLYCALAVHFGWLFALTAVLPAWRGASVLRARRRAARNLCRTCGYDLRASPGRCPECGTAVQSA